MVYGARVGVGDGGLVAVRAGARLRLELGQRLTQILGVGLAIGSGLELERGLEL